MIGTAGEILREPGDPGAHPRAGDPAGMDRCLDLRRSPWPSPGDGARRAGPQAIPLSPRPSARSGRARNMSISSASPRPLPRIRAGVAARTWRCAGSPRVESTRHHRQSPGDDADTRRQQRLRPGQQELWAHHPQQPAYPGEGRRTPVSFQGQERQDMAPAGQGPTHRQDRQGLPGAAGPATLPIHRRRAARAARRHLFPT